LPFLMKNKKPGLINLCGCLVYTGAVLMLPFAFLNLIFVIPFVIGILAEYLRQLKKFNICRKKKLTHAWFFILIPAYVQRIAFSIGFIIGLIKRVLK